MHLAKLMLIFIDDRYTASKQVLCTRFSDNIQQYCLLDIVYSIDLIFITQLSVDYRKTLQKQSQISYLSLSISSNLLKFCFQFLLQNYLISIFQ